MTDKDIIRNQLQTLLEIVLETNGYEARKQDETGNMPTMFMEYSGHVNLLKITIHPDGWYRNADGKLLLETYLDKPLEAEEIEYVEAMCSKYLNKEKEPSAAIDDSNSQ